MFKNYLTLAWRNLLKNKAFSIINILGLSVGIGFTLLIAAYIYGELQVNHNLRNATNQYVLLSKWKDPNMGNEITTPGQLVKALRENYPNLVANYFHADGITTNVSKGNRVFRENLQIGDNTMIKMYGFKLLAGDAATALNDPLSVIITQDVAMKYFNKIDVVGQTLTFEGFDGSKHIFSISGVLQTIPRNSVINYNESYNPEFFFTAEAAPLFNRSLEGWNNFSTIGFVELNNGISPEQLNAAIKQLLKSNSSLQISNNLTIYLSPLNNYNLTADGGAKQKMITALSLIAGFILLMAVINFVNICIGRSSARMREIGVRKVLGGMRSQLIWQFLTEAVILVLMATGFALVLYLLARPLFDDMLGKKVVNLFTQTIYFIPILLGFAILTGIISGVYPALVLSALKSVDSLKGKVSAVKQSVLLRKALVAFQFGTAAVVFIGGIIISQQLNLFFGKDLGYNKDYVIYAPLPRDWSASGIRKMESIRRQFAEMPQVKSVAVSWEIPDGNGGKISVYRHNENQTLTAQNLVTDNQFAATYSIPVIAGQFFEPVYLPADSNKVVINATQAKALGWNDPKGAVGSQFYIAGSKTPVTVSGVVADFHFGSMGTKILPTTFYNVNSIPFYRYFSIKLRQGNIQSGIAALQGKWSALLPNAAFEYHFMDEALTKMYINEIQLKKASYTATILAAIIVLLGVVGLISLSIQKRAREIGIRKVLGASVPGIIFLFLNEFLSVIFVAVIIACPLAYLAMYSWLNNYVYRISITFKPFVITTASLAILTIVLITVLTFKTALLNPVRSLRSE